MADQQKLKSIFPHGSPSFFELNSILSGPKPKQVIPDEPLGSDEGKKTDTGRRILRYTSYRCRLTDPDNLCFKYFTDALRYCGAIPNDTEEDILLEVQQKKVEHKNQEKTLIEIIYP
jgi:hypothetical protein